MKKQSKCLLLLIMVVGVMSLLTTACGGQKNVSEADLFGPNVYIFSPEDSADEVSATIDEIYAKQETNHYGQERYALLFKPGTYADNIRVSVGFYTQVAGLGELPTDTNIAGLTCNARWLGDDENHNATQNFWRSAENFSVKYNSMWAVSQAVSLRRMSFDKDVYLHDEGGWASGGFIADSVMGGEVQSGSQQQWFSRNSDWGKWDGQVWNMVFVGIEEGKAPEGEWPRSKYTTIEKAPVVQEKPFLTYSEEAGYRIFVPALREAASGTSWANGADGTYIDSKDYYIAKPDKDTAASINKALKKGKHLILTPGIYNLEQAIKVENENTIVLGLGLATLIPTKGNACIEVADVDGVKIAGLLFDAGKEESQTLLMVGDSDASLSHEANPIALSDLYFRVGGASGEAVKTKNCVVINSSNVIGDNFWVWRADHGDGVAWNLNTAPNGIIINGDNVTMYALMVEHFQEYQTIWNGNGGQTYFYQSEMPYDVPNQESWMSHDGAVNGYASYKVGDEVTSHEAWGMGIYSFHRDAVVDANSSVEVPAAPDVIMHNVCHVMLTGNPGISHIINDFGKPVENAGDRQVMVLFQNGEEVILESAGGGDDLAEGKSVFASSTEDGYPAENAVDGDDSTRWATAWTEDEWIYVDLGEVYTINKVLLDWEAAFAKEYKLLVSTSGTEDGDWTEVYAGSNTKAILDEVSLEPVEARYVKMQGMKRGLPYGYSLWSFQVFPKK